MSLFKKDKKEPEAKEAPVESQDTTIPAEGVAVPATESGADQEKPLTPEEQRERSSVKMLITLYPDTFQVKVDNVQNLTRGFARYMAGVTHETYKNDEQANLTVMKLIDTLTKSQQGGKIWVPGAK